MKYKKNNLSIGFYVRSVDLCYLHHIRKCFCYISISRKQRNSDNKAPAFKQKLLYTYSGLTRSSCDLQNWQLYVVHYGARIFCLLQYITRVTEKYLRSSRYLDWEDFSKNFNMQFPLFQVFLLRSFIRGYILNLVNFEWLCCCVYVYLNIFWTFTLHFMLFCFYSWQAFFFLSA